MPAYSRTEALESLHDVDPDWPVSGVAQVLADPANDELLRHVSVDAFTHVFPGDQDDHPPSAFLADLDAELSQAPEFHLWAELPLCRYRCHFCQFPILVLGRDGDRAAQVARRWVDANIAEARLWLDAVPALRRTPVGEFCLFGGTPTAVPTGELERLVDFYTDAFRFTATSSLRAEGSPDSLDDEVLHALATMGFDVLTYGIQSFDDDLLALANRRHTGAQAAAGVGAARRAGFDRVDADLVWGLPGQTVSGFVADVRRMIDLDFDTIVAIKLHLRSFHDVDSAIGHVSPAPWEDPAVRARIAGSGRAWPTLGRQYQMREAAVSLLGDAGHYEHPTTYFPKRSRGAERWRALNLDQDKQYPQVGIGLGGYTWSARSEANTVEDPTGYLRQVAAGRIPLTSVTRISAAGRVVRAVRMALSTCQPLTETDHRRRFPDDSLLTARWAAVFDDLAGRGLVEVDRAEGRITLTPPGRTLVEAVINTAIR